MRFLSGRAGWTWCGIQPQVTRMIPPPQNRAGYAMRGCLSSRWYARRAPRWYAWCPQVFLISGFPFSRDSGGWCNQELPERHHHGFPGSIGVTSKPAGSEELLHHIGDHGRVEDPELRRRRNRGRHARTARRQRRGCPEGCRSAHRPASHRQSPSARYEAICQSPFRYSPAALRSGFRRK